MMVPVIFFTDVQAVLFPNKDRSSPVILYSSLLLKPFGLQLVYFIGFNMKKMNEDNAKKILMMLDRINKEIDFLGNAILKDKVEPVPVHVNRNGRFRIS